MQQIDTIFSKFAPGSHASEESILLSGNVIETELGPMLLIADDKALYYSDFIDNRKIEKKVERLLKAANARLIQDTTEPMRMFEEELKSYFAGTLTAFKTPVALFGTPFTVSVWRMLQKIPYGKTVSYAELAAALGKPTAFRAAANANGRNFMAIIIPCHRVINTDGGLGGYSSGLERKKVLLKHESQKKLNAL